MLRLLERPLHGKVSVDGGSITAEEFASGVQREGDVLVRVEVHARAESEAVAAGDLYGVGEARVGRFHERSVRRARLVEQFETS